MKLYGTSLVVVADGGRARLFEERARGGPLFEISERLDDPTLTGPRSSAHVGLVHDRRGPASHTVGRDTPRQRDEAAFVRRVGQQISHLMNSGAYETLVLFAAPKALGTLRGSLASPWGDRVSESEAADRVSESPLEIRAALRQLRLKVAFPEI